MSALAIGAFLVTPRNYILDGEPRVIPGHIGIITDIDRRGVGYIQASADTGRVEEGLLGTHSAILGYVQMALERF
jgi:hypothetical protein